MAERIAALQLHDQPDIRARGGSCARCGTTNRSKGAWAGYVGACAEAPARDFAYPPGHSAVVLAGKGAQGRTIEAPNRAQNGSDATHTRTSSKSRILRVCHVQRGGKVISTGRDDRIRTCDPHTPSVMRYQAALRPVTSGAGAYRAAHRRWQGGLRRVCSVLVMKRDGMRCEVKARRLPRACIAARRAHLKGEGQAAAP
jgi:hypothetical protein